MANQEEPIYKCNYTKVDTGVKKNNRAKTRGCSKNGTNKKSLRKIDSGLLD